MPLNYALLYLNTFTYTSDVPNEPGAGSLKVRPALEDNVDAGKERAA
jgi:hypothetical protein